MIQKKDIEKNEKSSFWVFVEKFSDLALYGVPTEHIFFYRTLFFFVTSGLLSLRVDFSFSFWLR